MTTNQRLLTALKDIEGNGSFITAGDTNITLPGLVIEGLGELGMPVSPEKAINKVTVDLKMETIRIGSPHTLRIIKTNAAYRQDLADWKKDLELLELLIGS